MVKVRRFKMCVLTQDQVLVSSALEGKVKELGQHLCGRAGLVDSVVC